MISTQENYIARCLELAQKGIGHVAPNPMVGAVLVYNDQIIGEGYHKQYGQAHAEVNCINSVKAKDRNLIAASTLYVSLEPCNHFGKTPPCSDLILSYKIPKVVIGMQDPFKEVNGSGIKKLRDHGVIVASGILEERCKFLNRRFVTFHRHQRPYIVLKWAQTSNGYIGNITNQRLMISNDFANRWVHKMRMEESAILIGANTAIKDNPQLNIRYWKGKHPIKMLIDPKLRTPLNSQIFQEETSVVVFNYLKSTVEHHIEYVQIESEDVVDQVMNYAYKKGIQSILVEGGTFTLQQFIENHLWDESFIIHNDHLTINSGILAPRLSHHQLKDSFYIDNNRIEHLTKLTR